MLHTCLSFSSTWQDDHTGENVHTYFHQLMNTGYSALRLRFRTGSAGLTDSSLAQHLLKTSMHG